jgi:hypothetical protein
MTSAPISLTGDRENEMDLIDYLIRLKTVRVSHNGAGVHNPDGWAKSHQGCFNRILKDRFLNL